MDTTFSLENQPHRRYNPLTDEWVLVSPHRAKRPWQGQIEKKEEEKRPTYDPECYLCPGNARANDIQNPLYTDTFIFENDFGALMANSPEGNFHPNELIQAYSEQGICKVICFSPRHDLTLPEMEVEDIAKVVNLWQKEYAELGSIDWINHVQIFENKGIMMGCSNPHPHGQIWAQSTVPQVPARESIQQASYFEKHGRSMLLDYIAYEMKAKTRLVDENAHFVSLVPFWAVWPFEILVVSKRHIQNLTQLTPEETTGFADILKKVTTRYDNLFEVSFPYSAGIHQSPTDGQPHPGWHLHMHFYPPLLRSATVKKFMVGYEMLGEPQRDMTPEISADRLRKLTQQHYKTKRSS
jgi:UDPglucose--hexose-1-phosphate uridylyltransferase